MLDLLAKEPRLTQRQMAERLGVSVGRANYCLKALREKGAVKFRNFAASDTKFAYAYVLTPSGIARRAQLARGFLARKRAEYDRLRAQIAALSRELDGEEAGSEA